MADEWGLQSAWEEPAELAPERQTAALPAAGGWATESEWEAEERQLRPRPATFEGRVGQAALRFLAGGAESLAESAIHLGQLVSPRLREAVPGGEIGLVENLEELGLLTEAGAIERMAQGTGEVAAFFLPVNVASKFLVAARVPGLIAQFLPIGIGTYASMRSQAEAAGQSLGAKDYALAGGQILGAVFVGKSGEKVFSKLLTRAPEKLRRTLTEHASNAALGAALETGGAFLGGGSKEEMQEAAVEGALGAIIGAVGANRFPGVRGLNKANEKEAFDLLYNDMQQVAQGQTVIEQPQPAGFTRRAKFHSKTDPQKIREAATVQTDAWPRWLRDWVSKNALPSEGPDATASLAIAERIKSYSAAGKTSREVARLLRQEGVVEMPAGRAWDMVRATKALLGVPSTKDQVAFEKWKAEFTRRVTDLERRRGAARGEPEARPEGPPPARPPEPSPLEIPPTKLVREPEGLPPGTAAAELRQRLVQRGVIGEEAPAGRRFTELAEGMEARRATAEAQAKAERAAAYVERVVANPRLRELGDVTPRELESMFGLSADQATAVMRSVLERHQFHPRAEEMLRIPKAEPLPSKTKLQKGRAQARRELEAEKARQARRAALEAEVADIAAGEPRPPLRPEAVTPVTPPIEGRPAPARGRLVREQAPYLQAGAAAERRAAGIERVGLGAPEAAGESRPIGARLERRTAPMGEQAEQRGVPEIELRRAPPGGVTGVPVRPARQPAASEAPRPREEPIARPAAKLEPQATGGTSEGVFPSKQAADDAARVYDRTHPDEPPAEIVSIGPKQWVVLGRGQQDPVARQAKKAEAASRAPARKGTVPDADRVATIKGRLSEIQSELKQKVTNDRRQVLKAEQDGLEDEIELIREASRVSRAREKLRAGKAAQETPSPVAPEEPPAPAPARTDPKELRRELREVRARRRAVIEALKPLRGRARSGLLQEKRNLAQTSRTIRAALEEIRLEKVRARARAEGKSPEGEARRSQIEAKAEGKRLRAMRKVVDEVYEKAGEQRFEEELGPALERAGFTRGEYEGRSLYESTKDQIIPESVASARDYDPIFDREMLSYEDVRQAEWKAQQRFASRKGETRSEPDRVAAFLEDHAADLAQFPGTVEGMRWLAENRGGRFERAYERVLEELPKEPRRFTKKDFAILAGIVSGAALARKAWEDDVDLGGLAIAGLPFLFLSRYVPWRNRRLAHIASAKEASDVERSLRPEFLRGLEKKVRDRYEVEKQARRQEMPEATRREIDDALGEFYQQIGGELHVVRPPGFWGHAFKPVLSVLERHYGPHGKELAQRIFIALRNADSREGAIREELKLIRMPGKILRTAADPLRGAERDNLVDMWWAYSGNKEAELGRLPGWERQRIPAPISKHVEVLFEHAKLDYYGDAIRTADPAVRKAAQDLMALKKRWFPAFADEASELKIMVRLHDGTLVPFQPHLSPGGNYVPHMMRAEAVMPTSEGALSGRKWKQYEEKAIRAGKIQRWMATNLAAKHKVSVAEVAQEIGRMNETSKLPYYRYTLDSMVKRAGNVELSRFLDSPLGIEIDPAVVVPKYIRPAILRFEYARQFGVGGSIANRLITAAGKQGYDHEGMKKMFDVSMEQAPELIGNHGVDAWVRELTGLASISGLGLAGLAQLGSVYPILRATSLGLNPLAPRNWKSFLVGFGKAVSKTMADLGLSKAERDRINARLIAETGGTLEGERINWVMQMSGFLPRMATWALHLYGVVPIDRFLRSWAAAAGRTYADVLGAEVQRAVKTKDVQALKEVQFRIKDLDLRGEAFGGRKVDVLKDFARWDKLSEAERNDYRRLVGWTTAYRTQHRTRAADMPFLANHKYVRAIYKFSPFAIRQTQESFRQIQSEVVSGQNPHRALSRLLRWAVSIAPGIAAGWGIMHLQSLIREPDPQKRAERLARDPVWQRLLSLAAAGNFFPWIADWVDTAGYRKGLGRRLVGPVYGQILEASEYAVPAVFRGDPGPLMRYMVMAFGVPGISGSKGTPVGRLLGIPSGRELVQGRQLAEVPGLGPLLVPTPPGKKPYAESWWRREHPDVARFLMGQAKRAREQGPKKLYD